VCLPLTIGRIRYSLLMRTRRDDIGPLLTLSEEELARPVRRREDRSLLALQTEIEAQRREVARLTKALLAPTKWASLREASRNARRLYRLHDLTRELGLSRSTIYKWIQDGRFPAQVQLGGRLSRWRSEDIEAWLQSRGEDKA
jgi:prophage regulatory protein